MALNASSLNCCALLSQLRLQLVFFGCQIRLRLAQALDFEARLLLGLPTVLDVLVEILLLLLKLFSEVLDVLAAGLNRLLHSIVLLHRRLKLNVPQLFHLLKLGQVSGDLVLSRPYVLVITWQFGLHVIAPEYSYKLQNVRLDLHSVTISIALLLPWFKHLTVKRLHVHRIDTVGRLKSLFALCLRNEQTADFIAKWPL